MKISIAGSGYVGLITGVTFAQLGHEVVLVDVIKEKIDRINKGISPIYEEGLDEILPDLVENGRLRGTTDMEEAVKSTEITFIAVGTPSREDGSIDLRYVESAASDIGKALKNKEGHHTVVVKSTVIPGTTEKIVKGIIEKESGKVAGKDFSIAMNPEFLREGVALEDSMHTDRIVIGVMDNAGERTLRELYSKIDAPILVTTPTTAEMIKYTSNSFLAMKISFANEIANICDELDIDVYEVMKGVGMDHRISPYFLNAGAGFGGSCFPKDVKALISLAKEHSYEPELLKDIIEINDRQPLRLIEMAERFLGDLKGIRVAVLGLAFKPNTDDIRESRAIPLVKALVEKGAEVIGYDPKAMDNFRKLFPGIEYAESAEKALEKAEICMIQADWDEFKDIDYDAFGLKALFDGRRTLRKRIKTPYFAIGSGKTP
jgi:UDPglucose 6-dehydrogenase